MNTIMRQWLLGLSLILTFASVHAQSTDTLVNSPVVDDVVLTRDRFEAFNRGAFQFNDGWDQILN